MEKQNLVCFKTPFGTFGASCYGWQTSLPEIRPETIFDMNGFLFQTIVKPEAYLMDAKGNKKWKVEMKDNNEVILLGENGYQYGFSKEGDFIGIKKDQEEIKYVPNCTLITNVDLISDEKNSDEGKELNVQNGDRLNFECFWGKYFGYSFKKATLFSKICDETTFRVCKEEGKKGVLLKLDYSFSIMTTLGTFVDYFQIVEAPLKGFYHLVSENNGSKYYLGATADGQVMCWNDNQYKTTYWKIK